MRLDSLKETTLGCSFTGICPGVTSLESEHIGCCSGPLTTQALSADIWAQPGPAAPWLPPPPLPPSPAHLPKVPCAQGTWGVHACTGTPKQCSCWLTCAWAATTSQCFFYYSTLNKIWKKQKRRKQKERNLISKPDTNIFIFFTLLLPACQDFSPSPPGFI